MSIYKVTIHERKTGSESVYLVEADTRAEAELAVLQSCYPAPYLVPTHTGMTKAAYSKAFDLTIGSLLFTCTTPYHVYTVGRSGEIG